ncbi:type I restriction endonuclease subunit R [Sulfuricella sp. T08]|uniref:type I restriction enzyme subunit R domain-containing protein n=1 Tax=Sulfuricella sp. T08 TaxID=1632857 RepID=UPI000AC5EBC0|nr:type I restriction endonuclease subunit R [Sulfuricella sp. T08]
MDKMKYADCKALVAFSGTITDSESQITKADEGDLNDHKERDDGIKGAFDTDSYQVLIVASKFQTGFDQPKLVAMYVDKRLDGVLAVQTLSRLNRTFPGKDKTFVLDFRNKPEDILNSFLPFYRTAKLSGITDRNLVHTLREKLDQAGVYLWSEVEVFAKAYFDPKGKQAAIQHPLKQAHDRYKEHKQEEQELFRGEPWDDPNDRLSAIIKKMNEVFSGNLSDADFRGYATTLIGKMVDDPMLQEQAKANDTAESFSNGAYEQKLTGAVVDALESHGAMADQALKHPRVFKGLASLLLDEVYRQLREKAEV